MQKRPGRFIHGARTASHGKMLMNRSLFNMKINAIRKQNNTGVYDIHTNMLQYPVMQQPTQARIEQVKPGAAEDGDSAKFPPVSTRMARNFLILDTYYEGSPSNDASRVSSKDTPADFVAAFNGLEAVSADIKSLLPPDCRTAFDKALERDRAFQAQWGPEKDTMARREPIIDKAIVPYSMS